jgi:hypothetical protein
MFFKNFFRSLPKEFITLHPSANIIIIYYQSHKLSTDEQKINTISNNMVYCLICNSTVASSGNHASSQFTTMQFHRRKPRLCRLHAYILFADSLASFDPADRRRNRKMETAIPLLRVKLSTPIPSFRAHKQMLDFPTTAYESDPRH